MGIVSSDEAEDILQESFLKIWKNLNAFDPSLKLSSWIYRIVHNQAISCLRKKKSFGKNLIRSIDSDFESKMPVEATSELIDELENQEHQIHEVLHAMPLNYKEVLVLKFLENMSYEEISDILKIPEGTVGTRINRAKKAFRKQAEQRNWFETEK